MLLLKIGQLTASRVHHVFRTVSFSSQSSNQLHHFLTSRQKLPTTVSRWFYRQLPKLPLDAENLAALIAKDVTVFTYMSKKSKRFFLLLTIFGGMQFVFWANLAIFIKTDPTVTQSSLQKSNISWMDSFYAENLTRISLACFSLGKYCVRSSWYFYWWNVYFIMLLCFPVTMYFQDFSDLFIDEKFVLQMIVIAEILYNMFITRITA